MDNAYIYKNCAVDKNVPEIERYIRTEKERVRSIDTTLPFQRQPP